MKTILNLLTTFFRSNAQKSLEHETRTIAEIQFDLRMMEMSERLKRIDRFYEDTFVTKHLRGIHFTSHQFIKMLHLLFRKEGV